MSKIATAAPAAPSMHRPGLHLVDSAAPSHIIEEPLLPWTEAGDGRYECHAPAVDLVLLPVPEGQTMRVLELNGAFHILTGNVTDDRVMKMRAEDVAAGF